MNLTSNRSKSIKNWFENSVLDNHSNFTIKFTATYCNSAKHISYFLIRPSGMCTFCSLSGIFRANQIYNSPFRTAIVLVTFLVTDFLAKSDRTMLVTFSMGHQQKLSPKSVSNIDEVSQSKKIKTHYF